MHPRIAMLYSTHQDSSPGWLVHTAGWGFDGELTPPHHLLDSEGVGDYVSSSFQYHIVGSLRIKAG